MEERSELRSRGISSLKALYLLGLRRGSVFCASIAPSEIVLFVSRPALPATQASRDYRKVAPIAEQATPSDGKDARGVGPQRSFSKRRASTSSLSRID
jgi:hypothetical protein